MKTTILISILLAILTLGLFYIWDKPVINTELPKVMQNATTTPPGDAFTDPSGTYRFYYPKNFIFGEDVGYDQIWSTQATSSGELLARVVIPKDFDPGTNFSDAAFTLGTSTDPTTVAHCAEPRQGESPSGATAIDGMPFTRLTSNGAGAGNFYDTTSYRAVRSGECVAVEYTIHSTNIGNYPANSGIKEFDRSKVHDALERIVSTVTFLK